MVKHGLGMHRHGCNGGSDPTGRWSHGSTEELPALTVAAGTGVTRPDRPAPHRTVDDPRRLQRHAVMKPHSSAEESHRCSIVPETLRSGHLPAQRQAHWTNGA